MCICIYIYIGTCIYLDVYTSISSDVYLILRVKRASIYIPSSRTAPCASSTPVLAQRSVS